MTKLNEGEAKRDGESCIKKEGGHFSFGGRYHDALDDLGNDSDGAADKKTVGVAEEDETACSYTTRGVLRLWLYRSANRQL